MAFFRRRENSSSATTFPIRIGGVLALALGVAALVGCFFTDLPDNPSLQLPTHMYVDAENGSDASGDGTSASPFRTMTKALKFFYGLAKVDEDTHFPRAGSPLTLHVAEGVYNKNLGEEDGIRLNNVILKGEGTLRDDVKIVVGISVAAACRIEHVHCYTGINMVQKDPNQTPPGAKAIIEDIDADTGISITEFGPEVEIINSRLRGIHAYSPVNSITVWDCQVTLGGIYAYALNSITVRDCQVTAKEREGISIGTAQGKILIENNIINRCAHGVIAHSEEQEVTLRGNVISECSSGISIGSGANNILDSNIVTGCYDGIVVGGETSATVTVIGENTITGSQNYNIIDGRAPYSGLLLIRGITWDDPQPSGRVDGPTPSMPGTNYYIENEGNSLVF